MSNLRHLLPSAGNLVVFEAAGRHANFTKAAKELGMTQAAVSYAVRSLETQLGISLFTRAHRAVSLTESGRRFHADVTLGLSHIRKSAEDIRARGRANSVTLAASTAFASMWMLPRLHRLRDDLPDIDLRIQTADRDLDIRTESIELGVRGGRPQDWPDYDSALIAPEVIEAVASASYIQKYGMPGSVAELTQHRLIHLEEPSRNACDWPQWLASANVNGETASRGLAINDYVLVIQAVMEGQGIALAWRHLTGRLIQTGLLQKVTDHRLETGAAFHVIWPKGRPLSQPAELVLGWLTNEGREISFPSQSPLQPLP
ncbi:LysR substrate-binding domain-containing protein [Hoeflea sp. YIM 152468]|uniref:LysR substrate-binding domain-containing protein n=1 Tax=Hoeflea sp. YIM 152468 TaxID=3031759 RepID=UPI0023D9A69D|nr:LysR substrate-binding domain-containing protein [Hoeflea sp. YIM 152468]MDF1606763.1 LysR substrate-binding domain-containing protein [Hoeflea sp. YIM 152468]